MAFLEDGLFKEIIKEAAKSRLGSSIFVELGALALAPVLYAFAGGIIRPLAKSIIKNGMRIYDWTVDTGAEIEKEPGGAAGKNASPAFPNDDASNRISIIKSRARKGPRRKRLDRNCCDFESGDRRRSRSPRASHPLDYQWLLRMPDI